MLVHTSVIIDYYKLFGDEDILNTPERSLLLAILYRALSDLDLTVKTARRDRLTAVNWFRNIHVENIYAPFSYDLICSEFGLTYKQKQAIECVVRQAEKYLDSRQMEAIDMISKKRYKKLRRVNN